MKILVFNTAASETGALKILKDFHSYINENDKNNTWTFVVSIDDLIASNNIKIIKNKKSKINWFNRIEYELFETNKIIKEEKPDVIFSMQNLALLWTKIPQVIYFHQSLPYNGFMKYSIFKKSERFLAVYLFILKHLFKFSFKRAKKIIVQTKWLKDAIVNIEKIDSKKIEVIPPAIIINKKKDIVFDKKNVSNISFFYPTSAFEHKNISTLIDAFKIVISTNNNIKLYLTINGSENNYAIEIKHQILGYEKNIILLGRLTTQQVEKYYSRSAMIFPSYVESFGLPLLEARSKGTYILASDLPFSHEILEGYPKASFFDPFSTKSIAYEIKKYIDSIDNVVKNNPKDENRFLNKFLPKNTWGKIVALIENENMES